jgi:cellulose synthase/poly-beta-1,6-N-acetylglucosamine synthase-like glycosyltransferase/peptidoglycan/xylan/chitin deacetylase (PgdA/CDA1 family)
MAIFYDASQRRKFYLRFTLIVLFLCLFILSIFVLFSLFFLYKGEANELPFNTSELYEYYYSPLNDNKISLTFDDGPHPIYTREVMEILKKHDVPATFFFLGSNVMKYPNVVEEVSRAGFEIGNHTFTHSMAVHDSKRRLRWELRITSNLIETVTGKRPVFYRPPFLLNVGIDPTINPYTTDNEPLMHAFYEGYIPVGIDVNSRDWDNPSSYSIEANLLEDLSKNNGHIVLFHDGIATSDRTVEALEGIIIKLKDLGYEFVSLGELLIPPPSLNLDRDLFLGIVDQVDKRDVSELQFFLFKDGYLNKNFITGTFDIETEKAVRKWQHYNGIVSPDGLDNPEYGVVGKETRVAMNGVAESNEMSFKIFDTRSKNSFLGGFLIKVSSIGSGMISIIFGLVLVLALTRISIIFILLVLRRARDARATHKKAYKGGVSVLIPAHNEEENIISTIESVLKSTHKKLDVIVIDDGSTDSTGYIVNNWAKRNPKKIRIISIENQGKANALNVGISKAKYDVFVAMDADTIFLPDTVANLVRPFNDKSVGAVAGKIETINSRNLLDIFQSIEYIVGQNMDKRAFSAVDAVGVVPGPVGAWRKSAVIKCGGYSTETLVEDQDLTMGLLASGMRVLYEPKAIALTETPHTLKDLLKQRFRWIFGTAQCVWKYKEIYKTKPNSPLGLVVIPNTLLFGILIPLVYPLLDIVFLAAIFFGSWKMVIAAYLLFTLFDVLYSSIAFLQESKNKWSRVIFIPLQRIYYRQIIYYTVLKSILRAFEGTTVPWAKVRKTGQMQQYYLSQADYSTAESLSFGK